MPVGSSELLINLFLYRKGSDIIDTTNISNILIKEPQYPGKIYRFHNLKFPLEIGIKRKLMD